MSFDKNSKIYVAGHEGLVGSAVLRRFAGQGDMHIVTRTFQQLDLRRQKDVEDFFESERPEYVVLAAAKVGGILANSTYKAEFIYDNLMIAANVIHAAYKYGVTRLINLGSSCIYPKNALQPLKEEYILTGLLEETNEPYAIAKIAAIKLCRYYNEQYGTQFISLMPTNLYGANDNFNLETSHVLPALIRKFYLAKLLAEENVQAIFDDIKKMPLGWGLERHAESPADVAEILKKIGIFPDRVVLWGSGNVYREFMHVDDLAAAILFSLKNKCNPMDFFNVGTGEEVTIKELAFQIRAEIGFTGAVEFDETLPTGVDRKLLDLRVANNLGWKATISLASGIQKICREYISYHISNSGTISYETTKEW